MTLLELEQAVWARTNLGDAPAVRDRARIRAFLNTTHRAILSKPAMQRLRHGQTVFTSVAGQAEYGLNHTVARILHLRDATNDSTLDLATLDWWRVHEPDTVDHTGTPSVWVPLGYGAVAVRPAGTGLWVSSPSGTDTMTARIRAQTTDQIVTDATVALTGPTRVPFGTGAESYVDVAAFTLASPAQGPVSLADASEAGHTLAVIPPGTTASRYYRLALWPTPSAVLTYRVDFEATVTDLAHSTDEPLLPEDYHDLVWMGAVRDEYEARDDDRFGVAAQKYERRVRELQAFVYGPHDTGRRRQGWSNLGGAFPADRWTW